MNVYAVRALEYFLVRAGIWNRKSPVSVLEKHDSDKNLRVVPSRREIFWQKCFLHDANVE